MLVPSPKPASARQEARRGDAVEQAEEQVERLGRLEVGEDDEKGEGMEVEAETPSPTAGGVGPSPDRPDDGPQSGPTG